MGGDKLTGLRAATCALVALCAVSALADEIKTRTWTGNGADNLWTNPDNWEPSEVSGASYNNVFPAGRDWEVVIETAPYYHSLQLPEGSGTVTFKGAGQLKDDNTAYIQVGAGREINVDGVVFRLCKNSCSEDAFINGTLRLTSRSITTYGSYDNYHVIGGDAKVIVEGGEFGSSASYLCLSNNATLTVRGGQVHCTRYTFCSPDAPRESITRVKLLGGILWNDCDYAYMMSFQDGAHLEFLGGRLQWGRANSLQYNCLDSQVGKYSPGSYFAECLPQFGGELVIPTCTTHGNGAMKFYYSNRDYDMGGTVYVTNNCNEGAGRGGRNCLLLRGGWRNPFDSRRRHVIRKYAQNLCKDTGHHEQSRPHAPQPRHWRNPPARGKRRILLSVLQLPLSVLKAPSFSTPRTASTPRHPARSTWTASGWMT